MPVVAESPPLIFGGPPAYTPVLTPGPTPSPAPTRTPRPVGIPTTTPTPMPTPVPSPGISSFVTRHNQFINRIDELNVCFKRIELTEFSDQEFSDHSQIAMKDKYIVQEKDLYCSMQGVRALTNTLRRLGEE